MKKFLLYGHGGSYNHGAEAIVKTTIAMIRKHYDNAYIAVSSHFPEQDMEYDIDADEFFAPNINAWAKEKSAGYEHEKEILAREMYAPALQFISNETTCLSVGGDNFCYPNWHRLAVFQQEVLRKKAKSILWGCSVEPSAITAEMGAVLDSYTHILARESRTYKALKNRKHKNDVQLLCDPAFTLKPEEVNLPASFESEQVVGINISPLVMRKEKTPNIVKENLVNLIELICKNNMKVAFIPHVVVSADDDYSALSELKLSLPSHLHDKIILVDRKHSASQLKYIISKCAFFVCARTHASIAAYSCGVPTLVIGYSVKAAGIADDLGMKRFVLDVSEITSALSVADMFQQLYGEADSVKRVLNELQHNYIIQAKDYIKYV